MFEVPAAKQELKAKAGETVFIGKGTRFRPTFLKDSEYVPVCIPAFRPDRCIREDGTSEESISISENLKKMHGSSPSQAKVQSKANDPQADVLFHMTSRNEIDAARSQGKKVYFPKTFQKDGFYTHATNVPSRLIETANHFYQDDPGEWICLQLSRARLLNEHGIVVKDEEAMPVGDREVSSEWKPEKRNWVCPHIYGGIPLDIIDHVYSIKRSGREFVSIEGLEC